MDTLVRKRTANDDMGDKARGVDPHPGARLPDSDHVVWARNKSPNSPDRYGAPLAATLEQAGERLIDPQGVSRSTDKPAAKRPKRYRAGSTHLDVDAAIGQSAIDAMWSGPGAPEPSTRMGIVKQVLEAVRPRNELEGLIAVQMIAAHAAAMEAYRRAAIPSQGFPIYTESLNQAAKASRTFAVLLEALDRHRGKGSQQRVRVEHVHVHAGGQAVVGMVGRGRGGKDQKAGKPHAIAHSPQPSLPCQDAKREAVPRPGDGERTLPDARRNEPRRSSR